MCRLKNTLAVKMAPQNAAAIISRQKQLRKFVTCNYVKCEIECGKTTVRKLFDSNAPSDASRASKTLTGKPESFCAAPLSDIYFTY